MSGDAQPLYDLAPALELMALGLAIALVPLAWVWRKSRGRTPAARLQALLVLTLFLTFDLVLFGAFTRLTDSGLGCPDWPGCYGSASPVGAQAQIAAAQSAMPTGPVTHGKAWVEMVHRYLASSVGVLIIVLTLLVWRERRRARRAGAAAPPGPNPWWLTLTLVWICLQGAFGALTVTMKLFPAIVTLHLLGGVVLLALLCAQAVRMGHLAQGTPRVALAPWLRRALAATLALVTVQVLLGGWVSTNYAVLVCNTFPQCQGAWWPDMAFSEGFALWRPLGVNAEGAPLSFAALTAIHYAHRLAAYAVLAALALLAWALARHGALPQQARWLALLGAAQLATGLSNVVLDWPLAAAVLHTGGAAALIVVLTWALAASRAQPAGEGAVQATAAGTRRPTATEICP
ncbi:cytochrome c oxidase assembly protein subunit 15 [Oryzisolibacter propanilivorax]|uniref:Cytochrome c oxidase assembly protein subunit 15 n=1 Tax=Oryzisolibacter propanilivorax TaxID=1527607 RepID=A0A1G9RJV7_9BURK|nr:COX15/CtaA family protein [Oryzisolibacter propanilivorax]SDM23609.1 cytochrome c oxidase assembly protein subunit 15 [Oryzisolibacter propanilivorax]